MKNIIDLQIIILSLNKGVCIELQKLFNKNKNVTIVNNDIESFFQANQNRIDCLVSPANSYGMMDGSYDKALTNILGIECENKVQSIIKKYFLGEQPICTSFIIDTPINGVKLIHTPTMRVPSVIKEPEIVYHCTRSTLICALENDVKTIVLPAFGNAVGEVDSKTCAQYMYNAYKQILFAQNY